MIKKLYNWLKKLDYRIKFILVGGLNTVIGVGSYWIVLLLFGVNIFQNNDGLVLPVIVATIVSQVLGLINSYLWNKFFTFESKKKSKSETIKFILVYAVAFGVDYLLKFWLRTYDFFNEIVIAIITTIVTMIISFVGQKCFVFKYKKPKKISEITDQNVEVDKDEKIDEKENYSNEKKEDNK